VLEEVVEWLRSTRDWERPDDQHLLDEVADKLVERFGLPR